MKYDLLLWGATGYTGQFAAEYLATHYPPSKQIVTWAIGGRNKAKLEKLKSELIAIDPSCSEIGILVGDTANQQEIDQVVGSTRVVLSTAGPFFLCGAPIIDACVRLGVHYCDTCGEVEWVHTLLPKYHDQAEAKNVFIVPFCGYDSIPSDIGAFMMVDYIRTTLKREPKMVEFITKVDLTKGGIAGGTMRTVLLGMENKESMLNLADPYFLSPPGAPRPKGPSDFLLVRFHQQLNKWIGFFVMSMNNTRVVRRSAALLRYGENFTYNEYAEYSDPFSAFFALLGYAMIWAILQLPFIKRFVVSKAHSTGEGPQRDQVINNPFSGSYYAETIPVGSEKPMRVVGTVQSEFDAGYGETSKMVCESAICLATQMDQILQVSRGGVLTPASSMGGLLLERLRKARMSFQVALVDSNTSKLY